MEIIKRKFISQDPCFIDYKRYLKQLCRTTRSALSVVRRFQLWRFSISKNWLNRPEYEEIDLWKTIVWPLNSWI